MDKIKLAEKFSLVQEFREPKRLAGNFPPDQYEITRPYFKAGHNSHSCLSMRVYWIYSEGSEN